MFQDSFESNSIIIQSLIIEVPRFMECIFFFNSFIYDDAIETFYYYTNLDNDTRNL